MFELNTFHLMDCMEGMKQIPDKYFDLAIVDPQYGINAPNMKMGTNMNRKDGHGNGMSTAERLKKQAPSGTNCNWDDAPPPPEYFQELFRVSQHQIIWGGNYFDLPPTRCIICWDKLQSWEAFSQWEMAWTSFDYPAKMYRISNTGGANREEKIHPTQKPVDLYLKTLRDFGKPGWKILDTHVGSASSLIACHKMGFEYLGFEKEKSIFVLSNNRLEAVRAQQSFAGWSKAI